VACKAKNKSALSAVEVHHSPKFGCGVVF